MLFPSKSGALLCLLLTGVVLSASANAQQDVSSPSALSSKSPQLTQLAALRVTSAAFKNGESGEGLIRAAPLPPVPSKLPSQRPFRTVAFGLKANTLGVGSELATPLAHSFNLRSGFNWLTFSYPFQFDGVNYVANPHLKSSQTTLDWFPGGHGFHISPGVLYAQNSISATVTIPAGQNFTYGGETFVNSGSDPVYGKMSVVFPHALSPLLLIGFGNILPRSHRRFSVPFELGAAYTGAATVSVNLTGTACVNGECFSFADDPNAQSHLNKEVQKANEALKRVPVYPILSLGLAYHF